MEILRQAEDLHAWGRAATGPSVLVPTMGALHAGHQSLISIASGLSIQRRLGGCLVTIFVNPTQFNDPADLARYPRTLEQDLALCEQAGAAAVFVPDQQTVYPPGADIHSPPLPDVATRPRLEDAARPGHFAGVCQVVKRLFDLTQPAIAVFGEKDWQQLQVIRAMSLAQNLGVEIIAAATVREEDGLAMSSRNRFLGVGERRRAVAVYSALMKACDTRDPDEAERSMREELSLAGLDTEYAVVREATTLLRPLSGRAGGVEWRALIAARLGPIRLIDNVPWPRRQALS